MSNESEIKPVRRRSKTQTPRRNFLVEVERDEDGTVKRIKDILPMPTLQKGGAPIIEKVKLACEGASEAGNTIYDGKILMVLYCTGKPFKLVSKTVSKAIEEELKLKSGLTDRPE